MTSPGQTAPPSEGVESPEPTTAPAAPAPPTDPAQAPDAKAFQQMRKALAAKDKELEALRASAMTDQEKAIAAAKTEGATEFRAKWLQAVATNAVLAALSAKGVTAPELALGAMNLAEIEVDPTTGRADQAAIDTKVADVLQRYPMLAPAQGPQTFANGATQQRVTTNTLPATKDGKLDEGLLRWALGGGAPPA